MLGYIHLCIPSVSSNEFFFNCFVMLSAWFNLTSLLINLNIRAHKTDQTWDPNSASTYNKELFGKAPLNMNTITLWKHNIQLRQILYQVRTNTIYSEKRTISTTQLFQRFFPITDIATYRLNQSRGQIIWNA